MSRYRAVILVSVVALFLGVILSWHLRSNADLSESSSIPDLRVTEMRALLAAALSRNDELQKTVTELKTTHDKYEEAAMSGEGALQLIREEYNSARMMAGMIAVTGPGVEVTLRDSSQVAQPGVDPNAYLIHDEDVLRIISTLRAAGAEALAINDQRILAITEIKCAGPTISVNGTRVGAPFVIKAIGDPATLESALTMRGGVVDNLKYFNINVDVVPMDKVDIPGHQRPIVLNYAQTVKQ
jgi:uncharacterized protein YlxW (UPF0749 family)